MNACQPRDKDEIAKDIKAFKNAIHLTTQQKKTSCEGGIRIMKYQDELLAEMELLLQEYRKRNK